VPGPFVLRWSLAIGIVAALLQAPAASASAPDAHHPPSARSAPGSTTYLVRWVSHHWKYRFVFPESRRGYHVGHAAFGSSGCDYDKTVHTNWPINTIIHLRRQFLLPSDATNVVVSVAMDNDARVFINHTELTNGWVTHEGCASRDSLVVPVPDGLLVFGAMNSVRVWGRDRGGSSYLDAAVRADMP
jgi:hypothetical protein